MKKYLMMGAAALMMGASFTSCSNDKDLYDPAANAQKFLQDYQAAFISVFGQPAANQTWGFGDAAQSRVTRSVFANGNEWAANDRADCMYKVPPVLTDEQRNVVIKYFQTVKNPTYQDPQWTNYFIQQVYKGDPQTAGAKSPEQYNAADGQTKIVGSNNMDHLAAINGDFVDHNNNFNHGDCGVYDNVLNYKGTLTTVEETYPVNSGNEYRHADKINLMTNSTTASFGYYNSNSSVRRTEYTGLVSYQTIIDRLGAEANCLNDGWNRSFMGFDFEMMVGPNLFQDRYVKLSDIPGNAPQYIWDGERVVKWYDVTYDANWQPIYTFAEGYDEFIKINGQKIPYLITDKNLYAGTRLDAQNILENITQNNLKVYRDYSEDVKNVECLNLPIIQAAFEAGYYPTEDKAQTWVKVGGTADGYYSDWIVTLTEAKRYDNTTPDPTTKSIRIMAEDVAANAGSDIDFNDVVFDVEATFPAGVETVNTVSITIQAAGGTMPIYINGREVHAELGLTGPNAAKTMVNTDAGAYADGVNYFAEDVPAPAPFDLTIDGGISKDNFLQDVNEKIKITLQREGSEIEVIAHPGEPTAKIAVPVGTPWAKEKVNMSTAFRNFSTWVQTCKPTEWYKFYDADMVIK
jgi:hypothetical protein